VVDHVENDGYKYRGKNKNVHSNIYAWLIRNNFPSGFQLLCANCNLAKHRNKGVCPHRSGRFNEHPSDGSIPQAGEKRQAPSATMDEDML
jgi:hypothetical protein